MPGGQEPSSGWPLPGVGPAETEGTLLAAVVVQVKPIRRPCCPAGGKMRRRVDRMGDRAPLINWVHQDSSGTIVLVGHLPDDRPSRSHGP
jgi:hypothetical protein